MEILFGKNYVDSSDPEIVGCGASAAIGISRGNKDFNEDTVGFATTDERTFFALADAHWGDRASEVAVTESLKFLAETEFSQLGQPARWFEALCEQINQHLLTLSLEPHPSS